MAFYPERRTVFDDLIDDVFDFPTVHGPAFGSLMKTDVHEKDGLYTLDIDLPGFRKEDIKISLENGNLTVSAEHHDSKEDKDAKGSIIRQERYSGSASRSWYVGDQVKKEDIHASFKDGILTVTLPSEEKKTEEETKYIDIL
ncbi:Hsp20/alpha crystallin family protein [Galactobacillus timonensis]|uniref:Hsp20/alpha crystallin family protein n=1 Tax=Galactobacillus timonensis TaxID=2041840 RepID=UPI0014367552|nr:Hsp20/alpha crystallin family protein [Galactobacillus timonensis]MDY5223490.1 Hsp20/alpha crystallin family protein [Lachnospiraceae bacterium]MDY6283412.1 Hsp20/alpha crystallin family protein [Erysipelotrichaceae bacterium]MCI6068340.1 Hsp20/alpha crystallin family protein [Galactobacillus timonensis]MCI6755283.1 Hsp20/alpha crystallin family protein [Galactobacillus timonensis]MDD5852283.1 Hsp20/alpha crystallin family protein [Galactobacillus timonensis]